MSEPEMEWALKQFVDPTTGECTIIRKCVRPPVNPGDPKYGWVAYLTFLFQPRDASGLPASSDADALCAIEEKEIPMLEADGLAVFVGVVFGGGVKDLLFYTRDPDAFLARAAVISDGQSRFRVGCEIQPDVGWSQYSDLA